MELLLSSSIWTGLVTLVILEIILGIDNLVLITILSDKLPVSQRDRARFIGLSLALIIRLALLSVISWIITLTKPLLFIANFTFSGRDLIMLLGGVFLLFKAVTELHERLDSHRRYSIRNSKNYSNFWVIVLQIVVLDVIFSLDAIITAVGIVNRLLVMMTAVVIAMIVMLLASKKLTRFINKHLTIVLFCLSFLLMIGLSLIAEGFGFHIPKRYLYAIIGFSALIELTNQISHYSFIIREQSSQLLSRFCKLLTIKLIDFAVAFVVLLFNRTITNMRKFWCRKSRFSKKNAT